MTQARHTRRRFEVNIYLFIHVYVYFWHLGLKPYAH